MPVPPSYIKKVALQLRDDYKMSNTPFLVGKNKENAVFIGRKQLVAKFLEFLNVPSKQGVFLVTGYRGMGKTSFVNHVLQTYNKNQKEHTQDPQGNDTLISIHLTISQSQPREIDILKLMVNSVYDKFTQHLKTHVGNNRDSGREIENEALNIVKTKKKHLRHLIIGLIVLLFPILLFLKPESIEDFLSNSITIRRVNMTASRALDTLKWIAYLVAPAIIAFIYYKYRRFFKLRQKESEFKDDKSIPINRIKLLMERCHSSITEETGSEDNLEFSGINPRLFMGSEKRVKQFSIADAKEIEYELQQFLQVTHNRHHLGFIFIFDELDKVDPAISSSYLYDDMDSFESKQSQDAYQKELRDRKQAIINIIAGLKSFFTTAEARFIFIAGREMFDASLADIADRQSSISSIFTYVFYVESLLKEKELSDSNNNNASLSNAVESYLLNLFVRRPEEDTRSFFELVMDLFSSEDKEENGKIYFLLQNFITYLTYRSNGSPKKLIKAMHEFIVVKDPASCKDDKTIFRLNKNASRETQHLFLYFNYPNQYRIGFISYLYRPFLIQYGRSFKSYSDNIIMSTPYLFDHLLKFHPFAFSLTNLELIPEVLSTNKTPSLREHIKQIISYLGSNHLRDTDVELFDYKFYSRTINEIEFISKVFEQEAAAFNFTLDESYLIKLHVRSKIKELRSIYSKFLGDSDTSKQQIFSIAHLNGILGDLHFFDQEYDDAIVAYSDAIRPINHLEVSNMNMRDFITLSRNKLKLGLCFEKINSYEEALAFYSDSSMDAKRFMIFRLDHSVEISDRKNSAKKVIELEDSTDTNKIKEISPTLFHNSSMNDLLQIIVQSFLAKMVVQEKMGIEGLTFPKLSIALGSFLTIANEIAEFSERNYLIVSNAYLLIAKILYFKNSQWASQIQFDSAATFPKHLKNLIKPLFDKFDGVLNVHESNGKIQSYTRKPVLALYLNIISMCEVWKSRKVIEDLYEDITKPLTKSPTESTNEEVIKPTDGKNISFKLLSIVRDYLDSEDQRFTGFHYRYIATFLSNIGDCLLSMCKIKSNVIAEVGNNDKKANKYNKIHINDLFTFDKAHFDNNGKKLKHLFLLRLNAPNCSEFGLIDVLKCYYLSGQYFLSYGRTVSCSFQYRKILQVLRLVLTTEIHDNTKTTFLNFIKLEVVQPILEIVSQNTGHSDRHMITKAKNDNKIEWPFAVNNISNHPESREPILLYNYIKIKIGDQQIKIKELISSNYSFATQHGRILDLDFYAKSCYRNPEGFSTITKDLTEEDLASTTNYLFSMLSILRILSIYGTDYLLGFSYLAYTHFRLAKFLKVIVTNFKDSPIQIGKQLEILLGGGSKSSLDVLYHFKMARDYYQKAVQLHTAGSEYKKTVAGMIYLEDDFNDNASHFGAALDRYMMVNSVFSERISDCAEEIENLNVKTKSEESFWH